MNGILKNASLISFLFHDFNINVLISNTFNLQGEYITIHITPEAEFSYVSFESNIPQSSYIDVIMRVLDTFRPGKFIVTAFANRVMSF